MKIQVGITAFNRPKETLFLLKQIPNLPKIHVMIFRDKGSENFSEVIEYCHDRHWDYYETTEHLGKWGFWKLNNFMYEELDKREFDYFIQLPDDALLVENFFVRVLSLMEKDDDCVALFTTTGQTQLFSTNKMIRRQGNILMQANYLDCCFITTKKVMDGFRIKENWRSRARNPLKSSGVGKEQFFAYEKKTGRLPWATYHAMVIDYFEYQGGTSMHDTRYLRAHHNHQKRFSVTPEDREFLNRKANEFIVWNTYAPAHNGGFGL